MIWFIICLIYFDTVLEELVSSVPAVVAFVFEVKVEVPLIAFGNTVVEFVLLVEFDWENAYVDIDAKNMALNIVTDNTIPKRLCFLLTIRIICSCLFITAFKDEI